MRPLQAQFFLSYAIIGSLSPLLTVFLKDEKGLTETQIGVAMAMVSAANLISPTLLTLLADTRLQTRQILAIAYGLTSLVLLALLASGTVAWTLMLMAAYGLSIVAMFPLQDGLFFSAARAQHAEGAAVTAYPRVRVWGTIGFMIPAVVLWGSLRGAPGSRPAVIAAVVCAVASVFNALRTLPPVRPGGGPTRGRLPTLDAFRVLRRPGTRWLCLGLGLASGCSVTYHHFFPIYLHDHIHLSREWIPLVINLGVVGEVFYTLGYSRLKNRIGDKGILVGGLTCMIGRMFLLSHFPSLATALLVQVGHGLEIVALFVVTPMLLDRLAGDHFRNSMQGAFSMFMGGSRLVGSLIAGRAVQHDMLGALHGAALVGIVAWLIVAFGFKDKRPALSEAGRLTSAV